MKGLIPESPLVHSRKVRPLPSATIELAQKARILKAEGRDVIELAGGDPDFTPEQHILDSISDALMSGKTKYTHPRGIPELKQAISEKHKRENNIDADWQNEIVVTAGGKQAIAVALMALLENNEEVLIPQPSWVSYDNMTLIAGGIPKPVAAQASNNFKVTVADLEQHASSRTKIVILNNPQNPTGQVYSQSELEDICDWCGSRGIYLISDEVYEHIIFDGATHYSPASDERFAKFVITINAVSKTYSMTGLRLGWLHAPDWIVNKIDPHHQHIITCATSIVQWGAVTALQATQDGVIKRQNEYSTRRDVVVDLLSQSKTLKPLVPMGTFYTFLDIKKTGLSSIDFCSNLLDNGGLALCPGSAFGESGEGWVRMLFARDENTLKDACARILSVYR